MQYVAGIAIDPTDTSVAVYAHKIDSSGDPELGHHEGFILIIRAEDGQPT